MPNPIRSLWICPQAKISFWPRAAAAAGAMPIMPPPPGRLPGLPRQVSRARAEDAFPSVEVDRQTALAYLHRDNVAFQDAPLGYLLVRFQGLPLGFVKNIGNRCNSLHPQSRRIRMDIR